MMFRRLFAALSLTAMVFCALPCHAESGQESTEKPRYSPYYSGSFWGPSVRFAPTISQDTNGWALDLGLRQAFPMGLADTRISYRYDTLDLAAGPFAGHTVHLAGAFHPLFIFILSNDFLGWVLSSVYVEAGVGAQLGILDTGHTYGSLISFVWSGGAGFDIPLGDPDVGQAPWLNFLYRYQWATPTHSNDAIDGGHAFFLGLEWRTNGLLF